MSCRDGLRRRIMDGYRQQHGKCIWCGVQMLPCDPQMKAHPCAASWDHFYNRNSTMRLTYGGRGYAACRLCNSARGAFDELLRRRGMDISDIWIVPDVRRLHRTEGA